jgi:hypothetical protein
MKRMGLRLLTAVFMGASLMLLQVALAEAHTCSSVCNQIRRACLDMAKAKRQVARAVCEDGRAACQADCETCTEDCESCLTDCDAAREACLEAAEVQRQADKLACDELREGCPEACVEPIDNVCVQGCKAGARTCGSDAKKLEGQCKRECPNGTGRQACVRECRKQLNVDLQACANQEILCLATCAGITL